MILNPVPEIDLRCPPAAWLGAGFHNIDCAAVCLAAHDHRDHATLQVKRMNFSLANLDQPGVCLLEANLRLSVLSVTKAMEGMYANKIAAAEHGAYAVALGALLSLDPYEECQEGAIGKHFDFQLFSGPTPLARVEISGVLSDDGGRVMTRLKEKLRQVNRYSSSTPAYAAVVDFSHPRMIVGYAT